MAVLAQLKIQPLSRTVAARLGHGSNRLARKQFVAWPYTDTAKTRQYQIVASGYLQDQDLTALMVRAGI